MFSSLWREALQNVNELLVPKLARLHGFEP